MHMFAGGLTRVSPLRYLHSGGVSVRLCMCARRFAVCLQVQLCLRSVAQTHLETLGMVFEMPHRLSCVRVLQQSLRHTPLGTIAAARMESGMDNSPMYDCDEPAGSCSKLYNSITGLMQL